MLESDKGPSRPPTLFSLIVEWVLEDVSQREGWPQQATGYKDLHATQAAFMDDLLIWDGHCSRVQTRFHMLQEGFLEWGLKITPGKCSLYTSPKHDGIGKVILEGVDLLAQSEIMVMSMPFRVGCSS